MYKLDIKKLKIASGFLLAWYGFARWVLLAITNQNAADWLANPVANFVALVSTAYMGYVIYQKTPTMYHAFVATTRFLFVVNFYFLYTMIVVFIQDRSTINFGYLMLDIFIVFYYSIMLKLCYMTNCNKNVCNSVLCKV
jgi:hypothetical protein